MKEKKKSAVSEAEEKYRFVMTYHVPFLESAAAISNEEKNNLILRYNDLNAANAAIAQSLEEQKQSNQKLLEEIENENIKKTELAKSLEAEKEKNRILEIELQLQQMDSINESTNLLKLYPTTEDLLEILEQDTTQIDEQVTISNQMKQETTMIPSIYAPQSQSVQLNATSHMIQQKAEPLVNDGKQVVLNPLTGLELEIISSDEGDDEGATVFNSENSCGTFSNESNHSENYRSTISISSPSINPLSCPNCSYVAKRKYTLKIHQLQHCKATKNTEMKNKTCRMCQKMFTHDGLRSHLRGFIGASKKNRQIKSAHKSFSIEDHRDYMNEIKLRL